MDDDLEAGYDMVELSSSTRRHLIALFEPGDIEAAERILTCECAETLPLVDDASPSGLQRIRFAALRVSGGDLQQLEQAVRLAQIDWRDVLVAAGFADDPVAHERWQPRRFNTALVRRWVADGRAVGVAFGPNEPVMITTGPHRGKTGAVISLLAVEPEPRYTIKLSDGEQVEGFQGQLRGAG